jgi:hypothetical protein
MYFQAKIKPTIYASEYHRIAIGPNSNKIGLIVGNVIESIMINYLFNSLYHQNAN